MAIMANPRWDDLATWRGPTVNHGGAMKEQRGLVLHIAEGTYEGTISWQKNPDAKVSSHFVVNANGSIAQMLDVNVTAWTQIEGNGHWLSVENAGFTPNALTPAQVEANARLLARCHQDFGVPLVIARSPEDKGLGHHSMGSENGVNWGHSDCPGPAIIAQKQAIVDRAIQIVGGIDMTAPTPAQIQNAVWHTFGSTGDPTLSAGSELAIASRDATAASDKADKILQLMENWTVQPLPAGLTLDDIRQVIREELDKTRLAGS